MTIRTQYLLCIPHQTATARLLSSRGGVKEKAKIAIITPPRFLPTLHFRLFLLVELSCAFRPGPRGDETDPGGLTSRFTLCLRPGVVGGGGGGDRRCGSRCCWWRASGGASRAAKQQPRPGSSRWSPEVTVGVTHRSSGGDRPLSVPPRRRQVWKTASDGSRAAPTRCITGDEDEPRCASS